MGSYFPFREVPSTGFRYDLRLKNRGVIASIIGKTIVSFDGDPEDSLVQALIGLGFKLPNQ